MHSRRVALRSFSGSPEQIARTPPLDGLLSTEASPMQTDVPELAQLNEGSILIELIFKQCYNDGG